jgi:hypothetical protein
MRNGFGAFRALAFVVSMELKMAKKHVISIVDDDESVREGTGDLVRSMGFSAEAFSCAQDFLTSSHLPGTHKTFRREP